jgi:hypothetical protein
MIMIKNVQAFLAISTLFLVFQSTAWANMQTVSLPITVDYSLLRKLLVASSFTEEGESVTLVDEGEGCIQLRLATPQVSEQEGTLRVELSVFSQTGVPLGGSCFSSLKLQGYVVFYQRPVINPVDWKLSFETVRSELLNVNRKPTKVAGMVWKFAEPYIVAYLSSIKIDLMPPVNDIKEFVFPLFSPDKEQQAQAMLNSMRPGTIELEPNALYLPVLVDVTSVYDPHERRPTIESDKKTLEQTVALWEQWDDLLVYLITRLAGRSLSEEEKEVLVGVLLDTRYRFVSELSDESIQHDIVRKQFLEAWRELAPLFRKYFLQQGDTKGLLGYLGFFSSADALMTLDKLGPTFGVEISTAGLVRLVEMLQGNSSLLYYGSQPNADLQELFHIKPLKKQQESPVDEELPPGNSGVLKRMFNALTVFSAYAAANAKQTSMSTILQWKVPKSNVTNYIRRVERVLKASTAATLIKGNVPEIQQAMFQKLIQAMAWQESCFRQFIVKKRKLTYLLSYNGSSVGLMQVNERVWRGLYDLNRLRWDIYYNAAAGSEIAALYLKRYASREEIQKRNLDDETMARLVYAMYNGGPSQRTKFLKRLSANSLYESDELFWEKFQMVSAGDVEKVSLCLVGR